MYHLPLQISFLFGSPHPCQPDSSPQGFLESSLGPDHASSQPERGRSPPSFEGDSSQPPARPLWSCRPSVSLPTLPEVVIGVANAVVYYQASFLWKHPLFSSNSRLSTSWGQRLHNPSTELRDHSVNICLYSQWLWSTNRVSFLGHGLHWPPPTSTDWAKHLLCKTAMDVYRNDTKWGLLLIYYTWGNWGSRFYTSPQPTWLARRRARVSHPDLLSPKLCPVHFLNKYALDAWPEIPSQKYLLAFQLLGAPAVRLGCGEQWDLLFF